jgi:hypothetical protein
MFAGDSLSAMQPSEKLIRQDVVHERRLATTGNTGNDRHDAERKLDGDILQIILARADNSQSLVLFRSATFLWNWNFLFARQILPGDRIVILRNLFRSTGGNQSTAIFTSTRSNVNDVIRLAHRILIMLNDQNGILQIA